MERGSSLKILEVGLSNSKLSSDEVEAPLIFPNISLSLSLSLSNLRFENEKFFVSCY